MVSNLETGTLDASRIAVALSGGPDSMALCALLRKLYPKERIIAMFVNHNLGSHGVTEDESLAREVFNKFEIEGKILKVDWDKEEMEKLTKGQIQEKTRIKRYRLLLDACIESQSRILLTGHNLDDDIVTMMYRFGHGSGIDGIAGMKLINPFPIAHPESDCHFVGHPLLEVPKERLLKTCEEMGLEWNIDKSNGDFDYQRNSILSALVEMQTTGIVMREDLWEALEFFKDIRRDIHRHLVPVFSNSIFINKIIGDGTFIVQDDNLLKNTPVISRAIGVIAQYVAARFLPVKTKRMLDIKYALQEAFSKHQEEQREKQSFLSTRLKSLSTTLTSHDKTRRINVAQMTVGGATIYPLASKDALRRTSLISRMARRHIENGPAFLIQKEPPTRINHQKANFLFEEVELAPDELYLWDGRIYLQYSASDQRKRKFSISYMTMADVRELEALTPSKSLLRRPVYSYLGTTPGSHLYQIPVIREIDECYLAFPTLKAQYPIDKYKWITKQAGNVVLVSKFQCFP